MAPTKRTATGNGETEETMKIALCPLDIAWKDPERNLRAGLDAARDARSSGAGLLVLPEMFLSGFCTEPVHLASRGVADEAGAVRGIATREGIAVLGGIVAASPDGGLARNRAFMVDEAGMEILSYDKVHPFRPLGEQMGIGAGSGMACCRWEGVGFAAAICYDLRFPELFRSVSRDVECFVVIANWPTTRDAHWEALLRARAIENQCFVLGVNRSGEDGNGLAYSGNCLVFDPWGDRVETRRSFHGSELVEIDFGEVGRIRGRFPFLDDMDPPKAVDPRSGSGQGAGRPNPAVFAEPSRRTR